MTPDWIQNRKMSSGIQIEYHFSELSAYARKQSKKQSKLFAFENLLWNSSVKTVLPFSFDSNWGHSVKKGGWVRNAVFLGGFKIKHGNHRWYFCNRYSPWEKV